MQKLDDFPGGLTAGGRNFYENVLRYALGNRALTSAGLAIGTAANTAVKIANTVTYIVGNVFYSKTTAEQAFTTTLHDIAANATTVQERLYLVALDASGNVSIVAGAISSGAGTAKYPELPAATFTVIGAVRIAVAAGSTNFVAGTTALNNGALTVTYINLGCPPLPLYSAEV